MFAAFNKNPEVIEALLKAGDTLAAREILDRLMGKAKVTMGQHYDRRDEQNKR